MFKGKLFYVLIWIVFSSGISTILLAQTPTAETTPQTTEKKTQEFVAKQNISNIESKDLIHYGDLIDVDIVGSTEYDWRGKLNPEGFLNGIGFVEEPIYGLCRSEDEVAAAIVKGFARILNNPTVKVKVIDRSNRPVSTLFGAVKTAQRFQIRRPVRLNELIVIAGGITDQASGFIQIVRPANMSCEADSKNKSETGEPALAEKYIQAKQQSDTKYLKIKIGDLLRGNAEANPLIYVGDIITVEQAEPVYVSGGVVNPRKLNVNSQLTLVRAIDAAGGLTKDADPQKIFIFRKENGETKTIVINYLSVKSDNTKDFALQSMDIVEVPQKGKDSSRFPPVIQSDTDRSNDKANAPLKIIE